MISSIYYEVHFNSSRVFLLLLGLSVLLSITLFAFSNEPHDCLFLFFDDDKKLICTLTRLLTTNRSVNLQNFYFSW